VLRFLLWRLLGLLALLVGFTLVAWFLDGGMGRALRGSSTSVTPGRALGAFSSAVRESWSWDAAAAVAPARTTAALLLTLASLVLLARSVARWRRRYVRLRIEVHRTDKASAEALVKMFEVLHKRLLRRWWRRLVLGQPAVTLEVHHDVSSQSGGDAAHCAWMALCCPRGYERALEAALRTAYPNCRLTALREPLRSPPALLRLKKDEEFIRRVGDRRPAAPLGGQHRRRARPVPRRPGRGPGSGIVE